MFLKKKKRLGSFMLRLLSALWPDGAAAECVEREGRKVTARSGPFSGVPCRGFLSFSCLVLLLYSNFIRTSSLPSHSFFQLSKAAYWLARRENTSLFVF